MAGKRISGILYGSRSFYPLFVVKVKIYLKYIFCLALLIGALYGASRLYFKVTGGFTIGNITSDLTFDPRWETDSHIAEIDKILDQEYSYLSKGCQAYVFLSQDGNYVLKFFKYQRFRTPGWLNLFTFVPGIEKYQQEKNEKKKQRLFGVFKSWKIAFEDLPEQTGVVYLHLNKTGHLKKNLKIKDKMGFAHNLEADQYEFLVQKSAKMLCPSLTQLMKEGNQEEAQGLIDKLLTMLQFEYQNGYADNDHALMQNTGVENGKPIHIDVGQFIKNNLVKNPEIYHRELFNKTYKFRKWLDKQFPELARHLEGRLQEILGAKYFQMQPYFHQGDVAKIPHVSP